ncbi:MAG: alpha/beta fold hydrolase [Betaproteobacteria bacterium]|nr:alpha/beta fold hydrolase [Betaproteobacteria bacterium]
MRDSTARRFPSDASPAMTEFFSDPGLDAQYLRIVSKASCGASDIGECLAARHRMTEANIAGWQRQWNTTAREVERIAQAAHARGHALSASEAYLRASEYYRAAFYFCRGDPSSACLIENWLAHRDCFRKAMALGPWHCEFVEIPYGETSLDGYFFSPPQDGGSSATLIGLTGIDATAEEAFCLIAQPAVRRGFHALVFDGPGQGSSLFQKGLFLRPDYEAALEGAVAWLRVRTDVDPSRIVLVGRGEGGYLALRAAAMGTQVAALVADPGQLALDADICAVLPESVLDLAARGDPEANDVLEPMLEQAPALASRIQSATIAHGAQRAAEYLHGLARYRLAEAIGQIQCPTLIVAADNDPLSAQSLEVFEALRCEKSFLRFTAAEGADGRCEGAGQARFHQRVHDWIDETLLPLHH